MTTPKQYERVKSGELSINAAAVQAGIRPARLTIRLAGGLAASVVLAELTFAALAGIAATQAARPLWAL